MSWPGPVEQHLRPWKRKPPETAGEREPDPPFLTADPLYGISEPGNVFSSAVLQPLGSSTAYILPEAADPEMFFRSIGLSGEPD
ncbi:MAG: hypothetical protein LBP22_07190 [Deltaproteobacteria bacterium]|nr:hypothetical protein [Deltaproteobacteria bacterium]